MAEKKKVLIVEDNELNLRLFSDILQSNGYEVISMQDGGEAVSMIRKSIPDVVLMDVQLQGGSGLDLIREIKDDKYIKHIRVIAVTAFAMKEDKERIMAAGCEDYIAKPISIEPFLEMVAKHAKDVA